MKECLLAQVVPLFGNQLYITIVFTQFYVKMSSQSFLLRLSELQLIVNSFDCGIFALNSLNLSSFAFPSILVLRKGNTYSFIHNSLIREQNYPRASMLISKVSLVLHRQSDTNNVPMTMNVPSLNLHYKILKIVSDEYDVLSWQNN